MKQKITPDWCLRMADLEGLEGDAEISAGRLDPVEKSKPGISADRKSKPDVSARKSVMSAT